MSSVTIKDVAQSAGVSVATVSYVINDGPRPVTEETRAKVLAAMRQLHYEPNVSARRLRKQHSNVLGLAIAGMASEHGVSELYFLEILRGVGVTADQCGYDLMLFGNRQKLIGEEFYRTLARQRMIDGLVLTGSRFNPHGAMQLIQAGLPAVVIGRHQSGANLPRIMPSFEQDAVRLTQALVELGHRRIGLFLNDQSLIGERERLRGYQRALEANGLPYDPELVHLPPHAEVYPARGTVYALIERAAPTVVITAPYIEVCSFVGELDGSVAVATLDEEAHIPRPACLIAGVMVAKYEAGMRAVELLTHCIQDKQAIPQETVLSSRLNVYGAIGAPIAVI
jgi:DNA-binding LacI/PurR family transcriptional regulator